MAPRFSIITPVYNPAPAVLRDTIASVRAQTFTDWEWCLADDCSPDSDVWAILSDAARQDPRIRVMRREENGGISRASNDAIAMATGEYLALLDHDDVLTRRALASVAEHLDRCGPMDYVYSDEAKLFPDGTIGDTFYKPDWSPERMRSQMYTCHFSVLRKSLVEEVGGFRPEFDGSQDYDLVLRVTERTKRILHIAEMLYLWRIVPGSAADHIEAKPWALDAGRRAVQEHCDRVGIDAEVETVLPGVHRVRRRLAATPRVSIVIPTRGSAARVHGVVRPHVLRAVESVVARTTYPDYEIVLVADRATPVDVLEECSRVGGDRVRIEWYDKPFNFADKVNAGAGVATGDVVLLLNDDVELITPDWLETFVSLLTDSDVGMVGAKLYFADGTLQHVGHKYSGGIAHHPFRSFPHDFPGVANMLMLEREVSGNTAACIAVPRRVWDEIGGFSVEFPNNYNDVDFSLRVRGAGYRILWTPFVELFHYESMTREPTAKPDEVAKLQSHWEHELWHDPYCNQNYDPNHGDFVIGSCAEMWIDEPTWTVPA